MGVHSEKSGHIWFKLKERKLRRFTLAQIQTAYFKSGVGFHTLFVIIRDSREFDNGENIVERIDESDLEYFEEMAIEEYQNG